VTAVVAALALAFVSLVAVVAEPAHAVTQCSSVWYTIEVGTSPGRFVRPGSQYLGAALYPTGTAAEPWNNFFQLCRDPIWEQGDYGLRANLGGHYLKVDHASHDLLMASDRIEDTMNLLRIRNYDGNFQTLWSPSEGFYVGPAAGATKQTARTPLNGLNGTNLYRVRSVEATPRLPDIPCDPRGTLPGPCQWP
jgi:hypothetical protein